MTVYHALSAAITNDVATPKVRNTSGEGGSTFVKVIDGYITPVASAAQYSSYQIARLPSNAILKLVELSGASQGATGIYDVGGVYAKDSPDIGATDAGADVISVDKIANGVFDFGGAAIWGKAQPGQSITVIGATPALTANTTWTAAKSTGKLWDVLGLTADPGGQIDVTLFLTDEAAGTGAAPIYFRVEYALGN